MKEEESELISIEKPLSVKHGYVITLYQQFLPSSSCLFSFRFTEEKLRFRVTCPKTSVQGEDLGLNLYRPLCTMTCTCRERWSPQVMAAWNSWRHSWQHSQPSTVQWQQEQRHTQTVPRNEQVMSYSCSCFTFVLLDWELPVHVSGQNLPSPNTEILL